MKKLLIGFLVLGALVTYSLGIRHELPKISTPVALTADDPTNSSTGGTAATAPRDSSSHSTDAASYKDGTYTGSAEDAFYGDVQVKATIQGGKITVVTFLKYPDTHATSIDINQQAMPYLQQEAIKAQGSNVNIISGATYTSEAFIQSLSNALAQAS